MAEDINCAILELCDKRKLSAVSCMVLFDGCTHDVLAPLLKHSDHIDIGLHFCLTDEGQPLSGTNKNQPSYRRLLARSLTGQISSSEVAGELKRQYELFVQKCGWRPNYIDGHLHAHQLPGVRQGVIEFLKKPTVSPPRPYVRNTAMKLSDLRALKLPIGKAALISHFGHQMKHDLQETGVPTNDGFSGIYDFDNSSAYPSLFPRFTQCLRSRSGILVVHPGTRERWRRTEYETLRAFDFAAGQACRFQEAAEG
jgi:hypothetical protein